MLSSHKLLSQVLQILNGDFVDTAHDKTFTKQENKATIYIPEL